MDKITFKDLPDTTTPVNSSNLNKIQNNIENVINTVDNLSIRMSGDNLTSQRGATLNPKIQRYEDAIAYSTSEKLVGTWNGANRYAKIIHISSCPNATTGHYITGLKYASVQVVKLTGVMRNSTGSAIYSIPDTGTGNDFNNFSRLTCSSSGTDLQVDLQTKTDRSAYNADIIIEYTKI